MVYFVFELKFKFCIVKIKKTTAKIGIIIWGASV